VEIRVTDHSYPLTLTLVILALALPCVVLGTLALQRAVDWYVKTMLD
jgi:hypothetical protein